MVDENLITASNQLEGYRISNTWASSGASPYDQEAFSEILPVAYKRCWVALSLSMLNFAKKPGLRLTSK